jgi:hypothetical protein
MVTIRSKNAVEHGARHPSDPHIEAMLKPSRVSVAARSAAATESPASGEHTNQ